MNFSGIEKLMEIGKNCMMARVSETGKNFTMVPSPTRFAPKKEASPVLDGYLLLRIESAKFSPKPDVSMNTLLDKSSMCHNHTPAPF